MSGNLLTDWWIQITGQELSKAVCLVQKAIFALAYKMGDVEKENSN